MISCEQPGKSLKSSGLNVIMRLASSRSRSSSVASGLSAIGGGGLAVPYQLSDQDFQAYYSNREFNFDLKPEAPPPLA
jgi:hypothetical protein